MEDMLGNVVEMRGQKFCVGLERETMMIKTIIHLLLWEVIQAEKDRMFDRKSSQLNFQL